MRIQCLACDEEAHDFARALEDGIDPAIAHEALDRDRFITTSFERIGSLVTATATNLHGIIDDLPGHFSSPKFAHGGFEADVGLLVAIDEAGSVKGHRFHGEGVGGHARDLVGDGGMLPDGGAPLHAFVGPFLHNLDALLCHADAGGGQGEPARVEGHERDFEAFAFGEHDVLARNNDVLEANDTVIKSPQAHEMTAVNDFEPGGVYIDDESGDL